MSSSSSRVRMTAPYSYYYSSLVGPTSDEFIPEDTSDPPGDQYKRPPPKAFYWILGFLVPIVVATAAFGCWLCYRRRTKEKSIIGSFDIEGKPAVARDAWAAATDDKQATDVVTNPFSDPAPAVSTGYANWHTFHSAGALAPKAPFAHNRNLFSQSMPSPRKEAPPFFPTKEAFLKFAFPSQPSASRIVNDDEDEGTENQSDSDRLSASSSVPNFSRPIASLAPFTSEKTVASSTSVPTVASSSKAKATPIPQHLASRPVRPAIHGQTLTRIPIKRGSPKGDVLYTTGPSVKPLNAIEESDKETSELAYTKPSRSRPVRDSSIPSSRRPLANITNKRSSIIPRPKEVEAHDLVAHNTSCEGVGVGRGRGIAEGPTKPLRVRQKVSPKAADPIDDEKVRFDRFVQEMYRISEEHNAKRKLAIDQTQEMDKDFLSVSAPSSQRGSLLVPPTRVYLGVLGASSTSTLPSLSSATSSDVESEA